MSASSGRTLSPAVRDFLDVVAELLVRDLLTYPEGDVERASEPTVIHRRERHEC